MASEEALRERAVSLYLQGTSKASIAHTLGRSREWVYKWISRYKSGQEKWNESKSHAPIYRPNKTSPSVVEQVIKARKFLEDSPHLESGAYFIWHYLTNNGISPPSVSTINRILRDHGLTSKKVRYKKSGIEYPEIPTNTQIMDLIGPRYIRGGERYYLFTIISNDTRHAGVYPILSKSGEDITKSLLNFWKEYSIPDFLQMDNELSFKGSNRHPRGLGTVLRTVMSLNVSPVFIPVGEPWRNGVIERFNQKVEKTLLMQNHRDFNELRLPSTAFTNTHNSSHPYSTLGFKTPLQLDKELDVPIEPLLDDYIFNKRPPLDSSKSNEIHFIRLVRSDLIINVLNTDVKVNPRLMHTYVDACLSINENCLLIRQDNKTVQSFEFIMPLV